MRAKNNGAVLPKGKTVLSSKMVRQKQQMSSMFCADKPVFTSNPLFPFSSQCCRLYWCQDTASTTPSSASWPSSAAPPSTVSHSCHTTPPTRTLSSSIRVLHSPPRQGKRSLSPHARPAILTPQEAFLSQKAPINTQVSTGCLCVECNPTQLFLMCPW